MSKDDGGLLYPDGRDTTQPGISRRDWLAGLAMQGAMANPTHVLFDLISKDSYRVADAMIAEGKKE